MLRSLGAILAALLVLTLISFTIEAGVNALLMRLWPDVFPTAESISGNLYGQLSMYAYMLPCIAFAGYVAARVAGRAPVGHALAFGVLQALLVIPARMANPGGPAWPWVLGALVIPPAGYLGGLYQARKAA